MTALQITPPPARYTRETHPAIGTTREPWMIRSARLNAEGLSRLAIDLEALAETNRRKENADERTSSR